MFETNLKNKLKYFNMNIKILLKQSKNERNRNI